jgi:hypothetical protein
VDAGADVAAATSPAATGGPLAPSGPVVGLVVGPLAGPVVGPLGAGVGPGVGERDADGVAAAGRLGVGVGRPLGVLDGDVDGGGVGRGDGLGEGFGAGLGEGAGAAATEIVLAALLLPGRVSDPALADPSLIVPEPPVSVEPGVAVARMRTGSDALRPPPAPSTARLPADQTAVPAAVLDQPLGRAPSTVAPAGGV